LRALVALHDEVGDASWASANFYIKEKDNPTNN